jgi:hypothetical protein
VLVAAREHANDRPVGSVALYVRFCRTGGVALAGMLRNLAGDGGVGVAGSQMNLEPNPFTVRGGSDRCSAQEAYAFQMRHVAERQLRVAFLVSTIRRQRSAIQSKS